LAYASRMRPLTLSRPSLSCEKDCSMPVHAYTCVTTIRDLNSGCVVRWLYLPRRRAVHGYRPVSTLNSTWPRNMPQVIRPTQAYGTRPAFPIAIDLLSYGASGPHGTRVERLDLRLLDWICKLLVSLKAISSKLRICSCMWFFCDARRPFSAECAYACA
jgi:hypothetical protein